ncbi:MAG: hypothetical protein ACLUAM_08280 [Bifidobacterium adolescentis]
MAAFELIVCIIAAVVLSSFLSRFIQGFHTLVQIALGALASQLPFFPNVTLDRNCSWCCSSRRCCIWKRMKSIKASC